MKQFQIGIIGLGTMGANLARNAARHGAEVSVYNRTEEKTDAFLKEYGVEGAFKSCKSYKDLVQSLALPRAILIMVKAGDTVDAVIAELLPLLERGDILIDGGNSHFSDTERRVRELKEKGIAFIGLGVSGGEEGALLGPSMMPGGDKKAWKTLRPLLDSMAADDGAGRKCVSFLGEDGAGHFVKMVHNGIEYGIMQLIAESYAILKTIGGFSNEELVETYQAWSEGEDVGSYLMEITAKIFRKKEGGGELIDIIQDRAGQKGTGKWTTQAAHDYGVAIPTINAAVDARIVSGSTEERRSAQQFPVELDEQDPVPPPEKLRSIVRHALKLSIILTFIQGFLLIKRASEEEGWNIDLSEVARIWRGGCIIRSNLLPRFQQAFGKDQAAAKAAKKEIMERFGSDRQRDWRRAVVFAQSRGVAVPALAASLNYFDALRAERLPSSLIQAQRESGRREGCMLTTVCVHYTFGL